MNRVRSLDWRFLLPVPPSGRFQRLALIGADTTTVQAAIAGGLAAEVVDALDGEASADAVVCLRSVPMSIETAVATLAPGGLLYLEVDRGPGARSDATATLRRVARLGLYPIGRYWAHPQFDEPGVYLPLDVPGAVEWYFRTLFVITTPRARFLATPTRLAALVCGNRLTSLTPRICMILSTEAPAAAPGVLSASGLPERMRSAEARPLVLMGGGWWSRVVVFPFLPGSREPVGAVKLWRTPGEIDRVEREQRGQGRIRAILPPALRDAVPEPLGIINWAGHVGATEQSAQGQWLMARRHRYRRLSVHLRELELVSSWLTAFNTYGEIARRPWSDGDVATWFDRPLAEYRDVFGITEPEQRLAGAVLHRANELVGTTVPFVWCHNDFSELNVYCGAKSISVVDWEGLGPGLPATDLLYYLPDWLFRARRIANREETFAGFSTLFLEREAGDRLVNAARASLGVYTAALELDDRLPPLLLAGEWVRRAVGRHHRMFPQGVSPDRTRASNRFARYVSILADQTDVLFERPYRWGLP